MSISSDCQLVALIKNKHNEKAKLIIQNKNLYKAVDASNKNTLLHYAAEYGNPEIARFLIELGSEIDALNDLGETPLIVSLESELPCSEVIEVLLGAGADVDMNVLIIINSVEWLTENSSFEEFKILKVFLERGYDMIDFPVLSEGNKEIIELLLQTNIDLRTVDSYGRTLIHELAKNLNPGVIELLHDRNFEVNQPDGFGYTPLMYATQYGIPSGIEFLLNKGAHIEAINRDKKTALYLAVAEGIAYPEMISNVQVLLEHGANVQVETDSDQFKTIFDHLLSDRHELSFQLAELLIAHLALQERIGIALTDLIRRKINADQHFKIVFEYCQEQLSVAIYPSITLFDLMTASDKQLERFLRKEDLASELIDLRTKIEYFDTILRKRLAEASRIVKLRKETAEIICQIIKMNYDCYPSMIDKIINYLEEKDCDYLISIENKIF